MEQIKEIYYHPIFKIIILLLVLWMTASIGILYLEDGDLSKIENAFWWTIVTITTVGYGDKSPQTELGKTFAAFIMINGYATIAIPTGIISAEYTSMSHQNQSNIRCLNCKEEGLDKESRFCKFCGIELNK